MSARGKRALAARSRRIILGTYALSSGYYDAYYLRAQKVRTLIRRDFETAFEKVDVIVCPTSPDVAFPLGERTDDPLKMYLADIFTIAANLAGICGISVPCGFVHEGKISFRSAFSSLESRSPKPICSELPTPTSGCRAGAKKLHPYESSSPAFRPILCIIQLRAQLRRFNPKSRLKEIPRGGASEKLDILTLLPTLFIPHESLLRRALANPLRVGYVAC